MQQLVLKLQIFRHVRCINFAEHLDFENGRSVLVVTSCCSLSLLRIALGYNFALTSTIAKRYINDPISNTTFCTH